MTSPYICTPTTPAERLAFSQCSTLDRLLAPPSWSGGVPYGMACDYRALDAFGSVLNNDFELDRPVAFALAAQLARTSPQDAGTLMVAASGVQPQMPLTEKAADALFEALFSGGNLPGNIASSSEAALRAIWRRQAMNGFKSLTSGATQGVIRIGPHITIEPRNIGKGGELRKGARLMVRVRGLPMNVVHALPTPFMSKAGGQFAAMRVSARDLQRMQQAGSAIADARVQSSRLLRFTGGRVGGGVLAFGPSAVIDLANNYSVDSDGSMSMNWRGFAVSSAKSQSGNLVGFAAGAAVASGAVALGFVAAVGWPVVLVGLGAGIIAQAVWSTTGMDEAAEREARKRLTP